MRHDWPLYGLRIRSPRLVLRTPTDDDLPDLVETAKGGIHDPEVMPFAVPWTDAPSPAFERNTYQWAWRARGQWTPEHWMLNLAIFLDDRPIGVQSVEAKDFARLKTVSSGSWLGREYQGKGYGKEMRAAMLHFAFEGLGAEVAESEAWEENTASIGVSTSLGYERNGIRRRPHPRGEGFVTAVQFRLTKPRWEETERPQVTIEGLEECLEMFGVEAQ